MTPAQLGFALLSAVTVAGALGAVALRNVTRALLALVLFFFGIAGLFFMLRADFVGVIQILVYVGAVAVLIVFAIVLTRSDGGIDFKHVGVGWIVGLLAALVAGAVVTGVVLRSPDVVEAPAARAGGVEQVGQALMTTYVLPFELASVLLTAALIGAVVIALDEVRKR